MFIPVLYNDEIRCIFVVWESDMIMDDNGLASASCPKYERAKSLLSQFKTPSAHLKQRQKVDEYVLYDSDSKLKKTVENGKND